MKLVFLGTRGNIEHRSRRHRRHTSLLVVYRGRRVMIDCGSDWRDRLFDIRPDAVFVTHAHPDHAFGLDHGAPCPVFATRESWDAMANYPVEARRIVEPRRTHAVGGLRFQAFPVVHSPRAPAVGYRVSAGRVSIFYVPDVVDVHDRLEALSGVDLFIGDGATMTRPLVRRREGKVFGHTTVRAQLGWCREASVRKAIFTHCGSQVVTGDERRLRARLNEMAEDRGVAAYFAHDGMELILR